MTSIGSFHCLNFLTVFPKLDQGWQLTEVTVVTDQKDVRFSSGYVGDKSAKDCAEDYSEKIDIPEMLVKCWFNEDKTVLREVVVLSKHTAPFEVAVKLKNIPSVNEVLNRKYMDTLRREGLERTYQLLQANRGEHPMIPIDEISQIFGHFGIPPQNGLINLRKEVVYRQELPDRYECFC